MSKPLIFISCGQYTTAEKALGKSIYAMVEGLGMQPFFAEQVQDLKGLNENILDHLRDCSGFITVLHPRGKISRPDGSVHTRASVWIEQEIAITAYIQHVEKRQLPVIAFIHESVGREGIRDLLHLNPITFTDEMEVLAALPARLQAWTALKPIGIVPLIKTPLTSRTQDGHAIRQLTYSVVNNTDSRITQINGTVRVPAGILKHWSSSYGLDAEKSDDPEYRIFRFDERNTRAILPQSTMQITSFDFCIQCGINDTQQGDHLGGLLVSERKPALTIWIDGKSYHIEKTMKELSLEAGGN
ncbi:MAG TPA: hypothetical protein VFQ41_08840 [Candidatus Angelobacter sp.]|nr:hypothetical protein [Candidatus Angelobacter sp.]